MAETIVYDTTSIATETTGTSLTWSHVCSALGNRILFVLAGIPTADTITGVTYGGVAMTKVGSAVLVPGNRYTSLWMLTAPKKGSNDIVITSSNSQLLRGMATSYIGASQTGQPDSNGLNTASAVTSLAVSSTVVENNSWQILIGRATSGAAILAGTSTTKRNGNSDGDGIFDSNGPLSAGSRSLQFTWTGSQNAAGVIASFKPALLPEPAGEAWLMFR